MTALRFLDTNVLLYSISRGSAEAAKRKRAITLLERDDVAVSVRVLQEFYVQATRPTRSDRLQHDIAAGLIPGSSPGIAWLRFPVQETTRAVLTGAQAGQGRRCRAQPAYQRGGCREAFGVAHRKLFPRARGDVAEALRILDRAGVGRAPRKGDEVVEG
jgi:hypothetical protein